VNERERDYSSNNIHIIDRQLVPQLTFMEMFHSLTMMLKALMVEQCTC